MKYKLVKPINSSYSALEQVLTNRGILYEDIEHYLNVSEEDDLPSILLDNIHEAAEILIRQLRKPNSHIHIQVDKYNYCPL